MDVGSPGAPGPNEVLAAMNITAEDVDVCWVGFRDADERYQTIPRSDATIEIVMLPRLAVVVESLSKCGQYRVPRERRRRTNLSSDDNIVDSGAEWFDEFIMDLRILVVF